MDQPGKVANPARGQLNRENNIPLSPCVPENLVSRDGFSRPVPRQPAHLQTQAESGAYLRDSSRVPRRRPFMKPLMTNQNTTSPALHRQNQPPDSGSVHESQRRQLRLSLHRSHRNTCCVCFCVKSVLQFPRREEAKSLLLALQPPKVRFF